MKQLKQSLPNIISASRIPVGGLILLCVYHQHWLVAFWLFVVGFAGDGLDGHLARRWQAFSPWMPVWENLGDGCLVGGPLLGLVLLGRIPWWIIPALLTFSLITVVAGMIGGDRLVAKFGRGASALVYVGIAAAIGAYLWWQASANSDRIESGTGVLIVGLAAAYLKRRRLQAWLKGQYRLDD
jgi:phosphatidylglycerophosphate synthase